MDGQKCGHEPCTCYVDLGETFCAPVCRERARATQDPDPHGRCGCRHEECLNA